MSYTTSSTSATTVADLRNWISNELVRVANAFTTESQTTTIPVLSAAPAKPQIGQIVFADGSNWNPNSGRGLYYYDTGGWVHIA
tara:strand:+ start:4202 stop:4453 length:252 start_codon:yes stop_codon:yes gene_type:complete